MPKLAHFTQFVTTRYSITRPELSKFKFLNKMQLWDIFLGITEDFNSLELQSCSVSKVQKTW